MFTINQIIAHLVGDYLLQSHWMATEKTNKFSVALIHAIVYSLPLLFITRSITALVVIIVSHAVIDRWRLVRYLCWLKNQIGPKEYRFGFKEGPNGYHKDVPAWLSVWLMIIADNTIHIIINGLAISFL